jgi:hypothetical protein
VILIGSGFGNTYGTLLASISLDETFHCYYMWEPV